MTTYAVGHLRSVDFNDEIVRYLQEIDATLAPFGGAFVVHGATPEIVEGPFEGDLVVIRFPDREAARGWYASDAYQAILPLRTANAESAVFLVEDCGADHLATDILPEAA